MRPEIIAARARGAAKFGISVNNNQNGLGGIISWLSTNLIIPAHSRILNNADDACHLEEAEQT